MAASFFKSRERASSTIDAMPCYYKQELFFGKHLNHKISPGKWESYRWLAEHKEVVQVGLWQAVIKE